MLNVVLVRSRRFQEDSRVARVEYRVMLAVDVAGSSGRGRAAAERIREVHRTAMRTALERSGVDWDLCVKTDLGDGLRVIAPADTPKAALLQAVVPELSMLLRQHNHAEGDGSNMQIRLRAALHAGEVGLESEGGVHGRPLEILARLLDAEPLRAALRDAPTGTPLALLMSGHYYEDAVRFGSLGVLPEDFTRQEVRVKEFVDQAWLYVPAFTAPSAGSAADDVQKATPGNAHAEPGEPEPVPESEAAATFTTVVDGQGRVGKIVNIGDVHGDVRL